jgi:hypothetical protein
MDIIETDLVELGQGNADWNGLPQNGEKWRADVNAVMNFGFPKMLEDYRVPTRLVASQLVLISTELVSYLNWLVNLVN